MRRGLRECGVEGEMMVVRRGRVYKDGFNVPGMREWTIGPWN